MDPSVCLFIRVCVSPVGKDVLQSRDEVWHHHVDAFQVGAEQSRGVEDDAGQDRPADVVRYLEALNENHVESVERGRHGLCKTA